MPDTITAWDEYCAASYPSRCLPVRAVPDLLDFTFALGALRMEAGTMARLMRDADECGAARGPTLRAHLADLRLLASHAAALVAEAEEEAT